MKYTTRLYQQSSQIVGQIKQLLIHRAGSVVLICPEIEQAKQWHQWLAIDQAVLVEARRPASVRLACQILLQHEPKLLIGTKRLSLLPLTEAALVLIIDPEDPAHRQWDQHPRYHVLHVATQQNSVVCFSQAPRLEQVATHQIDTTLLDDTLLPDIITITPSTLLDVIRRHDQIVLWHNRTGVARYAICQACQQLVNDIHVAACPHCGAVQFRLGGFGTSALLRRIQEAFPDRPVVEITPQTKSVVPKSGSIIIGTNAIFSRIPWDQITAAVATSIDAQLAYPDWRSHEYALQQLIHLRNCVRKLYISTYAPQHPVIQAVHLAYPAQWYDSAIAERKRFGFSL